MIPFRLLILFGIGLLMWHLFGAQHMVCLMVFFCTFLFSSNKTFFSIIKKILIGDLG